MTGKNHYLEAEKSALLTKGVEEMCASKLSVHQEQDLCLITLELIIRMLTRKRIAKSANYRPVRLIYNWKWQKAPIAMSYKAISNKEPRIIHSLGLFSCFVSARIVAGSSFRAVSCHAATPSRCVSIRQGGTEMKETSPAPIDFFVNKSVNVWMTDKVEENICTNAPAPGAGKPSKCCGLFPRK